MDHMALDHLANALGRELASHGAQSSEAVKQRLLDRGLSSMQAVAVIAHALVIGRVTRTGVDDLDAGPAARCPVLVVEDDQAVCDDLCEAIKDAGYRVFTA